MTKYTIEKFWKGRLGKARRTSETLITGWHYIDQGLKTFNEAPLTVSTELGDIGNPESAPLLLVSAPGAVGKSTLARQIAFRTESVYVNLAEAGPVGENTLSGGLLQSQIATDWQDDQVALLIDGLDEARLRVTPEAFEAFLRDVALLSRGRSLPTVLFGRTGAIEYAWLVLDDQDVDSVVFEIGYYGVEQSTSFAQDLVTHLCADDPHLNVRRTAAALLMSGLRQQTQQDGDRFAGYAPVIVAVADRVTTDGNPGALVSAIQRGSKAVTLQSVVDAILEREHTKLQSLPFEDPTLVDSLYLPKEQLDQLVARRYRTSAPSAVAPMSHADHETYEKALETWIDEHPFRGGGGDSPSAVFDAAITGHALSQSEAATLAVEREFRHGANPFLSVFYPRPADPDTGDARVSLPPEHIGIVYDSVRARLALSESASLTVAERGADMDVEIAVLRNDPSAYERTLLEYLSSGAGLLRIGPNLTDAEIDAPRGRISIGNGTDLTLVAPISIDAHEVRLVAEKLVVETSPRERFATAVVLNSQTADATISGRPILRGDVDFCVSWPGAQSYPWSQFVVQVENVDTQEVKEGLQRLRRLVTAFRARGKDQLARIRDKIESPRMMKGLGRTILNALMRKGVVHLQGKLYILDATALGQVVGVTYIDCHKQMFPDRAIAFVRQAIAEEIS